MLHNEITVRVPQPREEVEPTPADLLRELIAARKPQTTEVRRRLRLVRNDETAPPAE